MEFIGIIFSNLFGFDLIIFISAIVNGIVYHFLRKNSEKLRGMMNHNIYVPHFHLSRRQADEQVARLSEEDVIAAHGSVGKLYSLFVNLTAIFPLLGILGTVVSLLGLAGNMENVTGNFYAALTSTFWGLIFAILFKFLDGMIFPEIESNDKSVHIFLDQYSSENIKAANSSGTEDPAPEKAEELVPDEAAPEEVPVTEIITEEPAAVIPVAVIEAGSDEE